VGWVNFTDGHLFVSAPSQTKENIPPHFRSRNTADFDSH
jgi:hypothetical protein